LITASLIAFDQVVLRGYFREVEECPRKGGHGDAVDLGDITRIEVAHTVHIDARPTARAAAHHRDIDVAPVVRADAPEPRCTPVAQDRVWPTRQNGSHEDTTPFEAATTDGIDAFVDPMQPARRIPPLHSGGRKAPFEELPKGDHSMLAIRQIRQFSVT
jgi:hypothetical protein